MVEIALNYPARRLSPNSRGNWQSKLKDKEQAREEGFWRAKETGPVELTGPLCAWITFYPPSRRRMDLDNAYSACKPFQDGICKALGIDDSQIKRVVLEWGEPIKGGSVIVRLEKL